MKNIFTLSIFISLSATAQTFSPPIDGEYSGTGEGKISLRTIVLSDEIVAASAFTGVMNHCSGEISGIGKYKNGKLVFTNFKKEDEAENCIITVVFDKSGKSAQISESNCSYFHGAACAFDGKLKLKK